jgi:hypothetical protein
MDDIIKWLMEGDPAIRWQVMRDLQAAPAAVWQRERLRTQREGWGAQLLAKQDSNGVWGGGLYTPKWISSTYTLLALVGIGLPATCQAARRGTKVAVDGLFGKQADDALYRRTNEYDQCISGMLVHLCAYFGIGKARLRVMVRALLENRISDGGWNCRIKRKPLPQHSSFHTTINVLEGLREVAEQGFYPRNRDILAAEAEARELLLNHRLFRSHRTGRVIDERWVRPAYPPRWHYDILRALDYFARAAAGRDPRLQESIELILSSRRSDGRWPLTHVHRAKVHFDMEKAGRPSRWNTLRALRVLRWWNRCAN